MEKWWGDHYGNHDDTEFIKWTEIFSDMMKIKMVEMLTKHENIVDGKHVFGMSKSGGCSRSAALKRLGYKEEPFSGSTNFTFWLGHAVEVAALATLEVVGYHIEETQREVVLNTVIDDKIVPMMKSTSDGITKILGIPTIISVKSIGYKMSGQRKGSWFRRGFAELPFEGVRAVQPSWYIQLQNEMAASGINQGLVVVAAKDIIKVFENDEYLGPRGNGSLSFYAEIIKPEIEIEERSTKVFTEQMISIENGRAGKPMYINKDTYQYIELEKAKVIPSNMWGGPNQILTGTFNPCGGCSLVKDCADAS